MKSRNNVEMNHVASHAMNPRRWLHIASIFIVLMLCGAVLAFYYVSADSAKADSVAETINFNEFTFTSSITDAEIQDAIVDSSTLLFEKASSLERTSVVGVSQSTYDFSRSFHIEGSLKTTKSPDGLTITFQPDGNFRYRGTEGSCLLLYDLSENDGKQKTLVSNALVAEFDTYYTQDRETDNQEIIQQIGGPHATITTVGRNGKDESVKAAVAFTSGETQAFSIDWTITDYSTGKGTYQVRIGSKTLQYSGFDPVALFGSDKAYLTITGALNFGSYYGDSTDTWRLKIDDFHYVKPTPAEVALSAKVSFPEKLDADKKTSTFKLLDEEGKVLQSAKNSGDTVRFDALTLEKEGVFTYYIQQEGSKKGVIYDTDKEAVTVEVVQQGAQLVATVSRVPSFKNTVAPAKLVVKEKSNQSTKYPKTNAKYKYTITVTNKGEGDATGVFIRRYMPAYTNFYSVDKKGNYGYINGKEHASWFIKKLAAGKSVTLTFTLQVHECRPDKTTFKHVVYYEETGSKTAPKMNGKKNPAKKYSKK